MIGGVDRTPRGRREDSMDTRNRFAAAWPLLLGLALLPGCASTRLDDADRVALYQAAAGEPAKSFTYPGRISSWTSIDDRHIAVWTRPREGWLLAFAGTCQDIGFAHTISLTSQGSRVYAGFDKVIVHGRNSLQLPCRIQEMRPLDQEKIRAGERELRGGEGQDEASGT